MTRDDAEKFKAKTQDRWVKLTTREERADAVQDITQVRKEIGEQIQILADICFFLDGLKGEYEASEFMTANVRSNVE